MNSYPNRVDIRSDVMIYSNPKANMKYYCRIKREGRNTGYITRSLDTNDLELATTKAQLLWAEIKKLELTGLPTTKYGVVNLVMRYASEKVDLSDARRALYERTCRLYFKPYFDRARVDSVTNEKVQGYWRWRQDVWKHRKPDNPNNHHRIITEPAYSSVATEVHLFNASMRHAFKSNWIARLILMSKPAPTAENRWRRASKNTFSKAEYRKIDKLLRTKWKEMPKPNHARGWKNLRDVVILMANTGIRYQEAQDLRWSDVTIHEWGKGKKKVEGIVLRVQEKKRMRRHRQYRYVIAPKRMNLIFDRIRENNAPYNEPHHNIFNVCGRRYKSQATMFREICEHPDVNAYYDPVEGTTRNINHLRSFYISQALQTISIPLLATQTGHSYDTIFRFYAQYQLEERGIALLDGQNISEKAKQLTTWEENLLLKE